MDTGRAAHAADETTSAPASIPARVPAPTADPGLPEAPAGPAALAPRRDPRPFTPGTLRWHMPGDIRGLLSLPAARVLQVAHPPVGAGVEGHSVFRTDPWGRARRSLDSLQLWVYGGDRAVE